MPLLVGTDGKNKMSKSLNNYIGITENPDSIFGKLMSISDELMWEYVKLLYQGDIDQLKAMHPKQAKLTLAKQIVSFYHSESEAKKAANEFERVFSKRQLPETMPVYKAKTFQVNIFEVLSKTGLVASKNEARRLLVQGGISLIDPKTPEKINTIKEQVIEISAKEIVLKIGKKKFLKIICPN